MSAITPNYKNIIDEQTQAFIVKTNNAYPEDAVQMSITEQRALYDAMCATFRVDRPETVNTSDSSIGISFYKPHTLPVSSASTATAPKLAQTTGCPIRRYSSSSTDDALAQIVYFHGGGFVVGSLESHDDICAEITDATQLPVVSVDYRLSPEHEHPAAFDDAYAAVLQAWDHSRLPIILVGDSAGGNLAACLSHALRGSSVAIVGQVLIYPGLGGDMDSGSYITHAHAPMLTTDEVRFYANIRGSDAVSTDPTLAPLRDTDFSGLPPTVIFSAACDPLSDDGMHYQQLIAESGGLAHWSNEEGLVHGYLRARHTADKARDSFDRVLKGLVALSHGQWPY